MDEDGDMVKSKTPETGLTVSMRDGCRSHLSLALGRLLVLTKRLALDPNSLETFGFLMPTGNKHQMNMVAFHLERSASLSLVGISSIAL